MQRRLVTGIIPVSPSLYLRNTEVATSWRQQRHAAACGRPQRPLQPQSGEAQMQKHMKMPFRSFLKLMISQEQR